MADTHPYISGAGNIVRAVNHLRNSFPATVTSDTFKKLGIAPNNESFVINTLRFVGVIDPDGKKTTQAGKVFSQHQDEAFAKSFSGLVKNAYKAVFELHGDGAWDLDADQLITFFRSADDTGAIIGKRQSATFKALAGLAGHGEVPTPKHSTPKKAGTKKATKKKAAKQKTQSSIQNDIKSEQDVGLTVRIEVNLPADGDQDTYDRIFKSIRENLLNG